MKQQMTRNEYAREMECDFDAAIEGAYYAEGIAEAREQGRVGPVAVDKLLRLRAYCDIGGVTNKADAFAMWVVQFVGQQIRVLNYY
ncbi:hypothetical protein, partial [Exiguobacterium indicum]|uniref:hypothetical protein n=1 Tax=Exiguobacterium indicum TaxID=296995 RepID=UPI0034DE5DF6